MADVETSWTWNFTGPTTMSKAQSRPFTPKEISWDLIGFDGNSTGCLRTHPGFRNLHSFTAAGLVGFYPITLTFNASTYFVGYVAVREASGNTIFDFYLSSDGTTFTTLSAVHTYSGATGLEVDIQCLGRYAYIYARGQSPQVVYLASATPTLTKVAAGPGVSPKVETQLDSGSSATISNIGGVASVTIGSGGSGYTSEPTVTFAAPSNPGRRATGYSKISGGVVTEIVITDPGSGYTSVPSVTFGSGSASATAVLDPNATNGASTRGRLAVLVDKTGTTNKTTFRSGTYGFAVQFLDSTTGRKTQISDTVTIEVPKNGTADQNLPILVRVWFPSSYSGSTWTRDVYDKALIYRTVNQGSGGTLYGSGALHLDHVITAPASTAVVTPVATNLRVPDTQLVYQDTFAGRTRADDVPPPGGVAQFLGSTLFVSRILGNNASSLSDSNPGLTPPFPAPGIGDLRWSTTLDVQPEVFSPFNRWVPPTAGNEIVALRRVGAYMVGASSDRMYRIGRAGAFIKVEEMHIGYGCMGKNTLEAVGTMVYMITGSGLKAVSGEGQLEDVTSLDSLLNGDWLSSRADLQMAFDANGQCMTILKPATSGPDGEAVCMWFGTNRITMLKDLPFRHVKTGNWIFSGKSQRRSLFVKRHDGTSAWGVYVADHERAAAYPKNLCGGTARFVTTSAITPTNAEFDCAAYKISDGTRSTVDAVKGGHASDVYSLAPMLQQWVGGNVGMQVQPETPEFKDFFRLKQISSCRAYFETAAVPASLPSTATWRAVVYRGMETDAYGVGQPLNHDGTAMGSFATTNTNPGYLANAVLLSGDGYRHGVLWSSLSPGWRCDVVGVEVRLLAFSSVGRILDSDRRYV